jgi:hypothetical protein
MFAVPGTKAAPILALLDKTYLRWIDYDKRFLRVERACVGKGTDQLARQTFLAFSSICTDIRLFHITYSLSRYGTPEIFNTDQGAEFTSDLLIQVLKDAGVRISMDGKGALIKALPGLHQMRYTQVASRCPRRLDEVRF